jgi:NAD(P)-dependent dehydrogenase (short-subunit alcohol dehydrogenase family)
VALVTGSTHGLGRHLALALAGQGRTCSFTAGGTVRSRNKPWRRRAPLGARSRLVTGDVRQWHQVRELMATVAAEYGRLDILINNVGDFLFKPLLRLTVEEWRDLIDSNLHSAFYGCKAALPTMVQQGWGRIINVGVANADRIHAYAVQRLTPSPRAACRY